MAYNLSLRINPALKQLPGYRQAVLKLLREGLDLNPPWDASFSFPASVETVILLDSVTEQKLRAWVRPLRLPLAQGAAYLVAQAANFTQSLDGLTPRERIAQEQKNGRERYYRQIVEKIKSVRNTPIRVIPAEGCAGLGKSRIMGEIARFLFQDDAGCRVLMAVPLVSNILDVCRELRAGPAAVTHPLSPAILLGRGQFVSPVRFEEKIDEMRGERVDDPFFGEKCLEARRWLAAGAPPLLETTRQLRELLEAQGIAGLSHLMLDLSTISPYFDDFHLELPQGANPQREPGEVHRRQMQVKRKDEQHKLVLMTHDMLAVLHHFHQNMGFDYLLLDEAHQIEQVMADTAAGLVSLRDFTSWLDANSLGDSPLKNLVWDLQKWLEEAFPLSRRKREDGECQVLDREKELAIKKCRDIYACFLQSCRDPQIEEYENWRQSWRNLSDQHYRSAVMRVFFPAVSWRQKRKLRHVSPRPFCSLLIGPTYVDGKLRNLWVNQIRKLTVLLSGTLTFGQRSSQTPYAQMALRLGLTEKQWVETARSQPTAPPGTGAMAPASQTVFLPSIYDPCAPVRLREPRRCITWHEPEGETTALAYPRTPTDFAMDRLSLEEKEKSLARWHRALQIWRRNVAHLIDSIVQDCAGGTLVIATSFEDVLALHELARDPTRHLIAVSGANRVNLEASFRALSRAGKRPVWYAPALGLKGLHLTDENSFGEPILRNLILVRCNWGANRSSTHLHRKGYNFRFEEEQTLLQTLQTLGRLDGDATGVPKHIWMLDGRAYLRKRSSTKFVVEKVREGYPLRETFPFLALPKDNSP